MTLDRALLTTREVARLLGVGTTSVKRWADSGLLRCVKTPGGHRRFPRGDVDTFLARNPHEIDAGKPSLQSNCDTWLLRLIQGMGASEIARKLEAEHSRHGSWFAVADAMADVLDEIGRAWARGDITVIQEHIISERIVRATARLSEGISMSQDALVCLLMAAEGDDHTLGLNLVELCMREAGWKVAWVGRRTPVHLVCEFITRSDIDMVAVSASEYSRDSVALADQAARLGATCENLDIPLLLGGRGLWPENPRYGRRVHTFQQLRELLNELDRAE
jgi:MerR family transcriptional regulator, light-induced transcriptional regulator